MEKHGSFNAKGIEIMEAIKTKALAYFNSVGITLQFIGWADTFDFSPNVQDAINRRYIAAQDVEIAKQLSSYVGTIQALAAAETLRMFGAKSDGKLPTTIVGIPPEVGALMGGLLSQGHPSPTPSPPK